MVTFTTHEKNLAIVKIQDSTFVKSKAITELVGIEFYLLFGYKDFLSALNQGDLNSKQWVSICNIEGMTRA